MNQKYHNIRRTPLRPPEEPKTEPKRKSVGGGGKKITKLQGVRYFFSVIGTTFLTLFLIIVITTCVVAVALSVYITQFADSMYDVDLKSDFDLSYSSFVFAYDNEAKEYTELLQLSADENRIWVDLEQIQTYTLDALVSTEDKRYYEHSGVDWTRTVAATLSEIFGVGDARGGGSTITQQLVRDITKDNDVNVGRKLREIFRAMSLEEKYSKHDIIESYLNRVAFGNTIYGIGSAAHHYYGKTVEELTIAESAILVGLLPSPVSWNPYTNPELARKWQLHVLANMHEQGLISYSQYEEARNEKVRFRLPVRGDFFGYVDERYEDYYGLQSEENNYDDPYYQNTPMEDLVEDPYRWNEYEVKHNWYVDAALKEITTDLATIKDISYESAYDLVRRGGYNIYLCVDPDMQEKMEEIFKNPYLVRNPDYPYAAGTPARETFQAAFVLMDVEGNVKALSGGLGDKPGNDAFNRATQAQRNIGSTVKPFGVYAPAIEFDKITYSTMLLDLAGKIDDPDHPGSTTDWPRNFEGNAGTGAYYPAWYAVMKSTNTISARTLNLVGLNTAFTFLEEKLGITTLTERHLAYSPLATGMMEIKLHELAGAYQIFGTGGVYYKPAFYSKVEDHEGNIVLQKDKTGTQAIGADTAWIVNRMMDRVVHDEAGSGRHSRTNMNDVEVVGKTGTANNLSDLLFCGLTPDYVGSVRIGYDDNREIPRDDRYRALSRIWSDVMSKVTPVDSPISFTPESSVLKYSYCYETGLLAGEFCPSTNVGYYKESNVPARCAHSDISFAFMYAGERQPYYR